jgi:glycosyltransferase involved in cell wall biosynthesis
MEEFIKRAKDNFDILLLVPDYGVKKGKNVTYLECSKWLHLSDYTSIKLSRKNVQAIKNSVSSSDIIFVQGPAMASYLAVYYGHKLHKKTIVYVHTLSWELFAKFFPHFLKRIVFWITKKISFALYNHTDLVIVPYPDLKKSLILSGIRTKVSVGRLGVDINKFSPVRTNKVEWKRRLGIKENQLVIGYVGRVSKEKNTDILLKAFQKLAKKRKNLFLLIVGNGPESQVKKFKETKNCLVTDFVPNVEIYLKAMDFFIMPSLTETTSLATLEAMATGLPVITTKIGYIQNYIIRNYNGLFFPRNNPSMLAIKIERLIKDQHLRENLGFNARKTVAYSFSWERSINKIVRLLRE